MDYPYEETCTVAELPNAPNQYRTVYGMVLRVDRNTKTKDDPQFMVFTDFTSNKLVEKEEEYPITFDNIQVQVDEMFSMDVMKFRMHNIESDYRKYHSSERKDIIQFYNLPRFDPASQKSLPVEHYFMVIKVRLRTKKYYANILECATFDISLVDYNSASDNDKVFLNGLYKRMLERLPLKYFRRVGSDVYRKVFPPEYFNILEDSIRRDDQQAQVSRKSVQESRVLPPNMNSIQTHARTYPPIQTNVRTNPPIKDEIISSGSTIVEDLQYPGDYQVSSPAPSEPASPAPGARGNTFSFNSVSNDSSTDNSHNRALSNQNNNINNSQNDGISVSTHSASIEKSFYSDAQKVSRSSQDSGSPFFSIQELAAVPNRVDNKVYKTKAYLIATNPSDWQHICCKTYDYDVSQQDYVYTDPTIRSMELIFTDIMPSQRRGQLLTNANSITVGLHEDEDILEFFEIQRVEQLYVNLADIAEKFYNGSTFTKLVELELYKKEIPVNQIHEDRRGDASICVWASRHLSLSSLVG
ncbi:predicted protein [Scheffersomyces stipitis CBS 6054]|uniref:Uncharacterized protein n=1 Tax=Scheffersomyces stipitis (strain ATCC 58785 / CBS 6054 / NBRC 10063 / NRRL Y-11545) TaxID=322104 RepID=A3LWC1_PICST|nr:predicted protein [Scheffersomyces stipitis CBS 6054]ABN66943.2 predicted protein [Scheffersomyces stipitis CBS 6054]KAG2734581.1 hypothetical protein G9P44_002587 [Scheffersomyces stipitis]